MKVNFYATLRQIAGAKTIEFPLDEGNTVRGLLAAVIERFPAMGEQLLDHEGELYGHVHVFVNGRDSLFLDGVQEAVLLAEDKIDIFPSVGGGAQAQKFFSVGEPEKPQDLP